MIVFDKHSDGASGPVDAGRSPSTIARMSGVVERYLEAIVNHDWDRLSDCLTDDIVRTGPFGDTYTPKAPYLEFISNLMPTLQDYSMRVDRVAYSADGRVGLAKLTETLQTGGTEYVTPEALVFSITDAVLISKIDIYIKRLGEPRT
jgi:ketosteroid isomerase-like protein